jgi:hypothetical protein
MSKKQFSRRSFVKSTALTGGVLLSSTFSLEAMANSSNNKKLKLALVGCGGRGTGAAVQALRADRDVELVAMADAFEDRLESSLKAISEELDGEINVRVKDKNRHIGFNSYQKAIDMADVVILATPPGFRPLHFKYAIDNDKHVFMEKPVATDANGVRQVLESAKIAKRKKLNVVVGLQRRYQNSYNSTLKLINNGEIGKIVSGQVYWNSAGVWVRKRVKGQTEKTYLELIEVFGIDKVNLFKDFEELKKIDTEYRTDLLKKMNEQHPSTFNLWEGNKYKSNILKYKKDYTGHHPTQKPVLLLEDLIKTFSNENDLIVDLTMGSGSTGVACVNTNRNFIGIEQDDNYFNIAKKRIND